MGRERQSYPVRVSFLNPRCHTQLNKLSCEGMSGFNEEEKYDKFLIESKLKDETLFVEGH